MKFLLQNFFPTDITVSNETIQTNVENALQNNKIALNSLVDIVKFVLTIQSPTATTIKGSTNTLLALQDFQKINGITVNDIVEKDGIILADLSIEKINFLAKYDITKHTITELYFKNITNKNGQSLPINTFKLVLTDANQDTINSFADDPLLYTKTFDPAARQIYTQNAK